jgi:MFS transporter, DHA1 family, tetracycline resistance protein
MQFLVIFLTILMSTIGFGVCIPVLPKYAQDLGASDFVAGLLTGVFSLMVFIASPLWGRLSDRIGRRPVLIISILGSATGYFIMGWAGDAKLLTFLFVARIIDGISGGNVGAAQAYLADISTKEERSKAMTLIGIAFGAGFVLGPALAGILHSFWPQSSSLPFYVVGVMCLFNALFVFTSVPESLPLERRSAAHTELPLSDLLRHADSKLYVNAVATYFMSLAAFSIMTQDFTLFGTTRFRLTVADMSYVMAAIGVVGIIVQGGILRRILPKYGEPMLARFGMLLLLASFILLPLVRGMGTLLAVSCLIAVGNSFVQPTLNGLASASVEPEWQGRAMGFLQGIASLGRGIGPILGGWLLGLDRDPHGMPTTFYGRTPFWVAALLVLVTLYIARGLHRPPGVAEAPAA